jgi:Domain of unknown function (DUF4440)
MKPKKQKQGVSLVRLRLSKTIRKVMSLEKEVWRAAKEKDARAFAKLVPADALMIFQSGKMTQPDYLATMKDRVLEENSIEDLQGYMPNPSTVILTYKTIREGSYKGTPFPGSRVIESTTWIKRQNRWVAILNQETPLQKLKDLSSCQLP